MGKLLFVLTLVATGGVLVGCGGDDDPITGPKTDASTDGNVTPPTPDAAPPDDAGPNPDDASADAADADAGPCDFGAFVVNLINTQTTATAVPSTNLGEACVDQQKQSDFTVLFP